MSSARICLVAATILLLQGCGMFNSDPDRTELACATFWLFTLDMEAGLISEQEIRGRLQEMNHRAAISPDDSVNEAGRRMLAGNTSGNHQETAMGITDMGDACMSLGYGILEYLDEKQAAKLDVKKAVMAATLDEGRTLEWSEARVEELAEEDYAAETLLSLLDD
jgi:hypothetical protein